jgi:hypothetical protein
MEATLIAHAAGAPIGFAVVAWLYQRRFGFTGPTSTAAMFLGVVVALDVLIVSVVIERSFAMFRSFLGTWLPFALIFVSSYVVSVATHRRGAASDTQSAGA